MFRRPHVPEVAGELDPGITQIHSSDYRNPSQLKDGPVLVVGASHSGSDIAHEAAAAGHDVVLCGPDTGQLPAQVETRRGRLLFRPDYSWIRIPIEIDEDGYPAQYRGVIAGSPGLYVVGIPFQHSFASMLIGGMGRDAERVARHIATVRVTRARSREPRTPATSQQVAS